MGSYSKVGHSAGGNLLQIERVVDGMRIASCTGLPVQNQLVRTECDNNRGLGLLRDPSAYPLLLGDCSAPLSVNR